MHVEPEFEAWLVRLVPGCQHQWVGASPSEINALEEHAGRPLPPFYRWLLAKMGHSMGPFDIPQRDMSIPTILSLYDRGYDTGNPDLLTIGVQHEPAMPSHIFLDLSRQTRNDAWVCRSGPEGGIWSYVAETPREWLAWGAFKIRTRDCTHEASGTLRHKDILTTVEPILASLHFSKVIPTGPFCGIYDRTDVGLRLSVPPDREKKPYMFFKIVGIDEAVLRSVLGTLAVETPVDVEIDEWVRPQ